MGYKKEQEGKSVAQLEEELSEVNEEINMEKEEFKLSMPHWRDWKMLLKRFRKILAQIESEDRRNPRANYRRKYTDLRISEDYQVGITDPVQKMREADYFNNGTWDQIYFALRLGLRR